MKSLLHKILLVSLLVILLPVGLAFVWTSGTLSSLVEHRVMERAAAQADRLKLLLEERKEIATGVVSWIAEVPALQKQFNEGHRRVLFQMLSPLLGALDIDLIEVMDREGRVFLRVQDPFLYGDQPPLTSYVRGLLKGIRDLPSYGVEKRGGRSYLTAAESIQSEGGLGIVMAGYALNSAFIARLEREVGGRVVVRVGGQDYSTEEPDQPRRTPAHGIESFTKIDGFPDLRWGWYRTAGATTLGVRFPLSTPRGEEGTISIYLPANEMDASISALNKTLFLVALIGSVLAFLASWYLSRRLTMPLEELVQGTNQVAAGMYDGTIEPRSKDEIGALASSFNHMLQELRRSEAEIDRYRNELERKFIERGTQLVEIEDKRAAMTHMIAHDLKNPLLSIKKTLERLDHSPPVSDPQGKRILEELLNTSDLVIGMVNEMLDLYRAESSELHLSSTIFELREAFESCLRILAFELEEKEIRVKTNIEPTDLLLRADKRRITRLLINLISNATRFSPRAGRLFVSARLLPEFQGLEPRLSICVEDEGPGIQAGELPAIFDRFYSRGNGNMASSIGLGLPYCKLVAESHGGEIIAQNTKNGGLSVLVTLPTRVDSGLVNRGQGARTESLSVKWAPHP